MGLRRSKGYTRSEAQRDILARPELLTGFRRLALLALVLVACKGDGDQSSAAPSASPARGPDHIVLRAARSGGVARAAILTSPDSVIWRSGSSAAIARILGFDADAGVIAYIDAKGHPSRIDLRSGEVHTAGKLKLTSLTSAHGSDIYGIDPKGTIARLSPAGGNWTFKPKLPATAVFSLTNGSIVVAGGNATTTSLWLLRPPEDSVVATAKLASAVRSIAAQAGDRLYFAAGETLVGVTLKNLETLSPIRLPDRPVSLQPTPSGDRIYVAFRKRAEIAVVDRYAEKVIESVKLPFAPTQLRMDPLGRYLLARHPGADSVWVIAVGTNRLLESQASRWTADLPAFSQDGKLAVARDSNVIFIEPETARATRSVENGMRDFWFFFTWNGFRPRAQGVDEPVTFGSGDSSAADSVSLGDTLTIDSIAPAEQAESTSIAPPTPQFTLSFAALLSENSARDLANSITIDGNHPKVVQTVSAGAPIYRVVLGPFAARGEADRVGRRSGRTFWVYEGYP